MPANNFSIDIISACTNNSNVKLDFSQVYVDLNFTKVMPIIETIGSNISTFSMQIQ